MPWSTERFANCLRSVVGQEKTARFIESCGKLDSPANPEMKAKYAKCLMDNFERQFPEDVRVKVMEDCGRGCVGSSIVERALQVKRKANDLAELVEGLNKLHIGGGKMKLEGNKIRAQYARCYCGVVSKTKEKFTSTWCNCSRGWFLGLFEKIFEKPVKVEMTETIIQGAKTCKFIITI